MSMRITWLLLILFWPIQPVNPAQIPSGQACRLESNYQQSEAGSQPEPSPDDIDLIRQKISRIRTIPTRSKIMPSRYMELREALAGYCKTGVPLVASDGRRYYPAGFSDDLGIYYFIPRLAFLTRLELPKAIDLFFAAPQIIAFLIAIAFLLPLLENRWLKVWAVLLMLVFTSSSVRRGDVYSAQTVAVLSIVPWSLHLAGRKAVTYGSTVFMVAAGIAIGIANMIRSQAATGVMIFLVIITALHRQWTHKQKVALLAALIAGFVVPVVYFHSLQERRDAFLAATQPGSMRVLNRHPFWHSAYIGFSFLPNPYVPEYRDDLVADKVRSIDPSARFLSPEYERIIRGEVLRLVREHPGFAIATMLAKVAAIGYLLLISANVGLISSALYPKPWPLEAAFWCGMGFNSLYGLLIIPHRQYLLGFTAFAILYGIVSLGHALECRRAGEPSRFSASRFSSATS